MSNQIEVKIQVIIHATEDSEKILKSFSDLFNIEQDKFKVQNLTGHFENPIMVISLTIKKIHAEKFMVKLFSKMNKNDKDSISANLEEEITNSGLKIRISKQKLIRGKIALEHEDAIKITIIIPVYIKKNSVKIYRQILKI
ncbi:MAG: exosome protein [Thaumarchaeota archaeon]|nr:exosome protein [Nitrososphaerota archaeon]